MQGSFLTGAVVVTNGITEFFSKAVDSVVNQSVTPDRIYIVDVSDGNNELREAVNAANQGLAENNFATNITVFHAFNSKSFGAAVNALVKSDLFDSQIKWIWLLHDDSEAGENTLAALLEEGEKSEAVGIVGAKQLRPNSELLINVGYTSSRTGRRVPLIGKDQIDQNQYSAFEDVLAVSLNGALIRLENFRKIGGINPKFAKLNDSLDFSRRMHLAGRRVVIASGASVKHIQRSLNNNFERKLIDAPIADSGPDSDSAVSADLAAQAKAKKLRAYKRLYAQTRSETIYRLSIIPLKWFLLAWIYFIFAGVVTSIKQLYSSEKGALRILLGTLVALFSWGAIVKSRSMNRRAKIVPRRTLKGLYASRKDIALIRRDERMEAAAALWADHQPSLLQTAKIKQLAKKRRAALAGLAAALTGLSIVHFAGSFGRLVAGGHFVSADLPSSNAGFWEAFEAATTSYTDSGFGAAVPTNPVNFPLALITALTQNTQLTLNLFILSATLLAGLSAWAGTSAATRNNAARVVASLVWVSLPSFGSALDYGRVGAVLAHILLPLIPLLVARGVGKAASDLGIGAPALSYNFATLGLVLALVFAAAPVLIPLLLAAFIIAGIFNRRFLFALVPALAFNIWLFSWVALHLPQSSLLIFFGDLPLQKYLQTKNVFLILFGDGEHANWTVIIAMFVILGSAICLLLARSTGKILVSRLAWLISVLAIALAVALETAANANASPLISVAYLGFLVPILIFQKQRVEITAKSVFAYSVAGALVVGILGANVLFNANQKLEVVEDFALPAVVAKINAEEGNPRVLVLNSNADKQIEYVIVKNRSNDFINQSDPKRIELDANNLTAKDLALRSILAKMLSAPNYGVSEDLKDLGIAAIYVPDAEQEEFRALHNELLSDIDSTPNTVRIMQGEGQALWRLGSDSDLGGSVTWDSSGFDAARHSPFRYIKIAIALIPFLVFAVLALPFRKRRVIANDI